MKNTIGLFLVINITSSLFAQNPIIRHLRTADPSTHIWDDSGILWIYTSGDPDDAVDYTTMDGYRAFSTTDMVNFKDHGVILHSSHISWGVSGHMFAPTFAKKNGKYYCFFPHAPDKSFDNMNCGVAVSDEPQGPFKDFGIIKGVKGRWIDPCVFTDDDGTSYLYWGVNKPKVAKLKENMIDLAEEPRDIDYDSGNFFEASYMHKYNGKYYFSYSAKKGGYAAIGDSPYGPFSYNHVINPDQKQDHHAMVQFNEQWYFFYHVQDWNGGSGYRRNTCVEKMYYNPSGTIKPIYPTKEGVTKTK